MDVPCTTHEAHEGCVSFSTTQARLQRSESKAESQTFAAPLLFYYAVFSLPPIRRLLFSPLRMGSGVAKRALHARAKPLAWCDDNSQPPVTPIGDMSVTSVVGRIFPGGLRNLGLDTKVSRYGNFKS